MIRRCILGVVLVLAAAAAVAAVAAADSDRREKAFSLFNLVTFRNDECRSKEDLSGGARNGTCYTSTECGNKGGTSSGNCASGFGVCCVFLVYSNGTTTISQNRTYLRNPKFPSAHDGTGSISYKIEKCDQGICQLRLDFETFTTAGPTLTTEIDGGGCVDKLAITLPGTGLTVPEICGKNTGQHLYLDMGDDASNTIDINLSFSGTSTSRSWEILVIQISCTASYKAPQGCLQYYTELASDIKTFNYLETTVKTHLKSQDYSVCIRGGAGYCCVKYQNCLGDDDAFTLDTVIAANGEIDSECSTDYIIIPSSSPFCSVTNTGTNFHSRYCGGFFGQRLAAATSTFPVCDCSAPFVVHIVTDDAGDVVAGNTAVSRGVCLSYIQVPCN